jgi:hypothetical protein
MNNKSINKYYNSIYGKNYKIKKSTLNPTRVAILETIDLTIIYLNDILNKLNEVNEIIQNINTKIETMTDKIEKERLKEYSLILKDIIELINQYIGRINKYLTDLNSELWKNNSKTKTIIESKNLIEYIINKLNEEFKNKLFADKQTIPSPKLPKHLPPNTPLYKPLLKDVGPISLYQIFNDFLKKNYHKIYASTKNKNKFINSIIKELKKLQNSKKIEESKFYLEGITHIRDIIKIYKDNIKVLIIKIFSLYLQGNLNSIPKPKSK